MKQICPLLEGRKANYTATNDDGLQHSSFSFEPRRVFRRLLAVIPVFFSLIIWWIVIHLIYSRQLQLQLEMVPRKL